MLFMVRVERNCDEGNDASGGFYKGGGTDGGLVALLTVVVV